MARYLLLLVLYLVWTYYIYSLSNMVSKSIKKFPLNFSRCFLHAKSYKFLWKILQLILDYLKIDGLAVLVSSQWR